MDTLGERGLLSAELENVRVCVRARHGAEIEAIESINGRAVKLQYELQIPRDSQRHVVVASLYIRTLFYLQSAILLIERGLDPPARVLLRASLEALFNLAAVAKDPQFLKSYVNADLAEKMRLADKLGKLKDPTTREHVAKVVTSSWKATTQAARDAVDAKKVSVEQAAKVAGLEELYNSAYALFSLSVHSTVRDLERQLECDNQGVVQALVAEPTTEGLTRLYLMAGEVMLEAVQTTAAVFNIGLEDFWTKARARLESFASQVAG